MLLGEFEVVEHHTPRLFTQHLFPPKILKKFEYEESKLARFP